MTDRELLELAAKAAGMCEMKWLGDDPLLGMGKMIDPTQPETTGTVGMNWQPLAIGADAFRLAVDLNISIECRDDHGKIYCCAWIDGSLVEIEQAIEKNKYYSVCRAIVRAAAEIGRGMLAAAQEDGE